MDFILDILSNIGATIFLSGVAAFVASIFWGGGAFFAGGMGVTYVMEKIEEFFSFLG